MKDVVRLVVVILVCQLPPVPKTAPARDFGRKHQRINGGDDDQNEADHQADDENDGHHHDHHARFFDSSQRFQQKGTKEKIMHLKKPNFTFCSVTTAKTFKNGFLIDCNYFIIC